MGKLRDAIDGVDWSGVGSVVKKAAPLLGTVLGGPAGGAAGALVASLFGTDADPGKVAAAISADPNAMVKLREVETRHKERLEELALEAERVFLLDRQNARAREVDIAKATGGKDYTLYALAWTVVVLFFVLVGIMMIEAMPTENLGPVNQLFGAIAAGFGMVLQYFFGSSKSSTDKTKLLTTKGVQE